MYLEKCYFSIWSFRMLCLTKFQEMEGPEIILGVTFMQNYYTNFNIKDQTIGFASVKGNNILQYRIKCYLNKLGFDF